MYAELHCWSNFTFLEGGSHPEELADRAAELGLGALALTDRDGLYGSVRFAGRAKQRGLAAIVGSELTFADGGRLVLLAEDERGYANLCELISRAQLRGRKGDARLRLDDFSGRSDGLIALSGGPDGRVERALSARGPVAAAEEVRALRAIFGERFHLELQQHLTEDEAQRNQQFVSLGRELHVACVATNAVAYAHQDDAHLTDVLRCIKHGTDLERARADNLLRPNAEFHLKSAAAMRRLFKPYPEALARSVEIAARCRYRLERQVGQFPLFAVEEGKTRQSYLRELVYRGAAERYGLPMRSDVERQLEYELGIIARMDLAGYFLIVWDIVQKANELGVLCQGRGSAANSAVCYALGITAVDPIGMQLLFERFMSEERKEIPDIDIDFAHQDREKVIQYIYERYGRSNAAMTAEVITYHARSALRDVGKALGLSLEEVDALAKELAATESLEATLCHPERRREAPQSKDERSAEPCHPERRREAPQSKDERSAEPCHPERRREAHTSIVILSGGAQSAPQSKDEAQKFLALCQRMENFPRHMGIHSGGMVLTRDPLVRVAPVEWATMRDRTIIQWDKDDLQELGLIKIDLLGLGMLSLLREAFSLHKRCFDSQLALHLIPPDDKPTYEMIQRADTVGVFQIESRAQQSMLPRMKPACFYDIVMQVAIIRPGPIQGEMVHPFLRRRAGQEPVTYPHPKLKPVLERTLGVPLFQEQGMRTAIEAAGFTPGEADQLRRAMGHKRSRARMLEIYPRLMEGMIANGIESAAAEQLFHMLQGFADYGFPESHAASFALLAYASSYVKCRFPAIFAAAILNVQPMGFYSTEVLVNDARRHGVVVKPVEVNASEYWSYVDGSGALRLGFHLIRGLGEAQRTRLEAALVCERNDPLCHPERSAAQSREQFANMLDFAQRTQLEKEALENLAIAGAFSPWYKTRREAMWALRALDEREARGELGKLMDVAEPAVQFKPVKPKQETAFDLWSTGVTPQGQAMMHFRAQLDAQQVIPAAKLVEMPPNLICKVGGLVITRQRPGTAKGFVFLTLEDETGLVNVIVRPDVYERYRRTIRSASMLVIEGKLQRESGCIDVIARHFYVFDGSGIADGVRARNFR